MRVRAATPEDSEALIHTHYAAVHETAAAYYPPAIIEAWSRKPDDARYQWMRQIITQAIDIVLVAEDETGVLGFGIIIIKLREMRALYVNPTAGRKGVGEKLMQELENCAAKKGISCLTLNASMNAEEFYKRIGYKSLSHSTLRLSEEYEMDCIKMEKRL